jgi:hypothetical protein
MFQHLFFYPTKFFLGYPNPTNFNVFLLSKLSKITKVDNSFYGFSQRGEKENPHSWVRSGG